MEYQAFERLNIARWKLSDKSANNNKKKGDTLARESVTLQWLGRERHTDKDPQDVSAAG